MARVMWYETTKKGPIVERTSESITCAHRLTVHDKTISIHIYPTDRVTSETVETKVNEKMFLISNFYHSRSDRFRVLSAVHWWKGRNTTSNVQAITYTIDKSEVWK